MKLFTFSSPLVFAEIIAVFTFGDTSLELLESLVTFTSFLSCGSSVF